jgi:hypothetical protein
MNKKISIIIFSTIGAIVIAAILAGMVILPAGMKAYVTGLVSEKTGCRIVINKVVYLPPTQYYLRDIILYGAQGDAQESILRVDEVCFSLKLLPFLKGKRVIASLSLNNLVSGAIKFNGRSSIYLKDLRSPARRPFLENMDGLIALKDFSVEAASIPLAIKDINGTISLEDNKVKLTNTSFSHDGVIFGLEGLLDELDIDQPELTLKLTSDTLNGEADLIYKEDRASIKKLSGTILNSSFNITGDIKDISRPIAKLYCEAKLNLEDLAAVLPDPERVSGSLRPSGQFIAAAFYNGPLKDIDKAEASVKISSKEASLGDITINDIYIDAGLSNGLLNTNRFNMRPYAGLFNGSARLDLSREKMPFSISASLKDADLRLLAEDIDLNGKELSGFLSSKSTIKGRLRSPDALSGSGWVTVAEGRLWEVPLLGGITKVLKMPNLKSVVFEEAAGNFVIKDKKISTDDLTFYSDTVNITAAGGIGFDKNIDFLVNANITQSLIDSDSDAGRIASMLLTQAGNYMGKIKVTGTLDKPEYKLTAKPVQEIFGDEIKGLLKNIFQ